MAFVFEVGVNSYGSVAEADDYHTGRGNTTWLALTTDEKQARLVRATDYIDQRWGGGFLGYKTDEEQLLEFPRNGISGFTDDVVPTKLKYAQFEYALRAETALAPDPVLDPSGVAMVTTMMKAGPVEQRFATAAGTSNSASQSIIRPYPMADMYLRGLVYSGDRVYR